MNKLTKLSIVLLILLNLVLITFLYLGRPKNHPRKLPKEIIIQKLDFNETQQGQYEELITIHMKSILEKHKEIARNKNKLYSGLGEDPSVFNDSITNEIANTFKEIDKIHFDHFNDIKNLCNEDQKEKFKELSKEFESIFRPIPRKKRRKRKKD